MTTPFMACIADALKRGEIDEATAAETRDAYDAALEAGADLGPIEADRQAAAAAMTALERKALKDKIHRAQTVRARTAALNNAKAFLEARGYTNVRLDGGNGGKPPKNGWTLSGEPPKDGPYSNGGVFADYLKELVDGSGGRAGAPGPSIKGRYQALMGGFQAMMADLAEAFDSQTGLPYKGRALLDNLVREAFGEETGDGAAKALAKAWGETADYARKLFNAAGGDIGKLADWGLPQSHDAIAIQRAGAERWIEAVLPRLDTGRMIDPATDLPFSQKRLRAVLGEVWQTITTRGAVDRGMGEALGQGKLASRRADHRFLIFKDADNWLAYQAEFGRFDPYAAMMQHLDGMARDVAQLQVLGPNPEHQFNWLSRAAERMGAIESMSRPKAMQRAQQAVSTARGMYGMFTGEEGTPYGANNVWARAGQATRSALTGMQLGSAIINDFASNPVMAALTKAHIGMAAMPDFRRWATMVTSPEARARARRTGFILENARARQSDAVQRYLRAETAGQKTVEGANAVARLLPQWVNMASFLSANTEATRFAFQDEFMGFVFDKRGSSIAQLAKSSDADDRSLAALLQARGFSEADWKIIGEVEPDRFGQGIEFLSPQALNRAGHEDLGWRLAEMIERETRGVSPEPSLWAQWKLSMGTRPGTVGGELIRSAMSYRSFTVTQTYLWLREFMFRAAAQQSPNWRLDIARRAAPLVMGMTLGGVLAMWTKDMIKGNDPRPAWSDDPEDKTAYKFWAAAAAQGGGMAVLGDFMYAVEARNGKSSAMTAFGPAAGFVSDTFDLTWGNVDQAIKGEETHAGRDLARYAGRYNPLASLWWSRTIMDRAVIDQIQQLVDPEAEEAFQRTRKRLEDDYGQTQWWPEGQAAPERAPDLTTAAGGGRP